MFRAILERDPAFAPAQAGLADAYAFMSLELPDVGGMPLETALAVMGPAAERALTLDPLLAEAHAALALVHARRFEWTDADRSFRRALELHPGLSHVSTTYSLTTLLPMGRFREAEALLRDALERDPLSLEIRRELAFVHLTDGRYDEAMAELEAIRALDPDLKFVELLLARARSLGGRIPEAMPYWESVSGRVGSQHWMAYAFVRAGRRAEIEHLAASPQHPYRAALFHAALGNRDRALEALAQAAQEAPHRTALLLVYPELSALRSDPRFEAIRRGFNLGGS